MDILNLNDLKGITPERASRDQSQERRRLSPLKERPIYALPDEKSIQVYSEGLKIKVGTTPLAQVERLYIKDTLDRHNGDREKTAKALNLDRSTLNQKIKRYELGLGKDERSG